MVVRRQKKTNKLRGQRSHGKGDTKNRRGAGVRGGVGKAGSHKHKFSKYYTEFGVKIRLKPKQKGDAVNIADLEKYLNKKLEKKLVEKNNDVFIVDGKKCGLDKILGRGQTTIKIETTNVKAVEKAKEKIEELGGKIK
ncbi:MAG: 50S ribosomal protein L15 [Candidatus Diapherotrites archaeon CG10_big_fil_rev_8_21_14_0_10_31_34]|nr:MAG: 50S ribosomal protein L15 [Candidatus Diapherotrites archaeon CG10_big_fil_rev_8_21_14_0_10_31_34]PJA20608.1 MAG: 50S ribosomal protein L15 [Candidatus Diapherotrites archaeon CG_4_10_14_0_2_um_filter_31_5]